MTSEETNPRDYIIGIIIFIMLSLGGITLINEARNYNPGLLTSQEASEYSKLNTTFQKLREINESISSIQEDITNTENKEFGAFGVLGGLINSAWNTLRFLFTSVSFMNAIFAGFTEFLGVPDWVSSCIIMIVIVIIVFAIYKSIFKAEV
jgi:uncharacterized BrkB/YihY/UPF0761 family membrane protein